MPNYSVQYNTEILYSIWWLGVQWIYSKETISTYYKSVNNGRIPTKLFNNELNIMNYIFAIYYKSKTNGKKIRKFIKYNNILL